MLFAHYAKPLMPISELTLVPTDVKIKNSLLRSLRGKISVCTAVFCEISKVLIISNSKIVKTRSELIQTSSELISTRSELISTRSELISTSSELISTIGE